MLAQAWLYGRRSKCKYDPELEKHLRLPEHFNPHSSHVLLNTIAERIVFTDDIPSMLYDMYENRQLTYEGVLTSAKLPYDCFWIEYSSVVGLDLDDNRGVERAEYGALIQRISGDRVRMIIVIGAKYGELGSISCISHVVEFDEWPPKLAKSSVDAELRGLQFNLIYVYNAPSPSKLSYSSACELGAVVTEIIFGIFLVTQPKIYSSEQFTYTSKHKRARDKRGKPPLLEYKRIRIHVGRPIKKYTVNTSAIRESFASSRIDTESDEAITHRRYHKVMGHFRHYIDHDPPHTTWIEPHYRGDPALGITFTERDVSK